MSVGACSSATTGQRCSRTHLLLHELLELCAKLGAIVRELHLAIFVVTHAHVMVPHYTTTIVGIDFGFCCLSITAFLLNDCSDQLPDSFCTCLVFRRSLDVSVYVERVTVDVDALARVLVLQVHPHCLLRLETHCSSRRKFLAVGEDTLVLNVTLEVLDQLLDCLDDVLTFGIFSEFSKSDSPLSLVIGATDDVLLNSVDLCTEKINRSAGFRGLVVGVCRQGFDLRDLIGCTVNFPIMVIIIFCMFCSQLGAAESTISSSALSGPRCTFLSGASGLLLAAFSLRSPINTHAITDLEFLQNLQKKLTRQTSEPKP